MKRILLFVIGVIVYRLLLDLIYFHQIVPFFSYWLMIDQSTTESGIISWVILALFTIPVIYFYKNNDESRYISNIFVLFVFFVKLIPLSSIIYFQPQSLSYIFQQTILWIILFVLLAQSGPIRFNAIQKRDSYILFITIIVSLAVLIVSGVYANFRLHFNLSDVYDLRFEAREFNMPKLLKYIYSFAANVIPICIVYYILKQRYVFVYLLAFVGLLNFSIAGSKSTLFRIVLCLLFLFLKNINFKKWILPAFLCLTVISFLEYIINDSTIISTLIIRRSLYIPNLLDSVYYDYLQNLDPYYFDTTKYTDLQFNIGNDVFGNDKMRANNGFFTDAYINLGTIGCFVYPFIYSTIIRFLAGACENHSNCIKVFSTFLFVTTLQSTFFTTSLLTHGLALIIVTLYLMPNTKTYSNRYMVYQ